MIEGWTEEQIEALKAVTGDDNVETAYQTLLHDGTLIEEHRVLCEANAPKQVATAADYAVSDDTETTLPKPARNRR